LVLAAAEIELRRRQWAAAGFDVGRLTWRDVAAGWPYPLVTRAEALSPDSVGVHCVRGDVEFTVVLFEGGWADIEGGDRAKGETEHAAPEILDVQAFGRILDATFERWSGV